MMAHTLEISLDFTIEDVHKIREYNYETTKHVTVEEKLHYYNTPRTDAGERIERPRDKRNKKSSLLFYFLWYAL